MVALMRRSPSRALTVVGPFYHPLSLLEEAEMLARNLWNRWQPLVVRTRLTPSIDMYEEKDELVMRAELPGIKKEEVDIQLEGECLTIKAEKKQEEVAEDATHYACERCFGYYSLSVSLPFPVDADRVSATLEDGVLEIKLPKAEEAKSRHIEVKVG